MSILLERQQGLYFGAQMPVPSASPLQELGPLLLRKLQSLLHKPLDSG
ncbi:MAG: hypothetical protein ABSD39_08035 [Terriglobales bacterium]